MPPSGDRPGFSSAVRVTVSCASSPMPEWGGLVAASGPWVRPSRYAVAGLCPGRVAIGSCRPRLGLSWIAFRGSFVTGLVEPGYRMGKMSLAWWGWRMSGAGADGPLELVVEPRNDRYDPDDDGWRDQVATLYADLDAQVDTVHRARPVQGAKGAVDQLIVALGSAGRIWCGGGLLAGLAGARPRPAYRRPLGRERGGTLGDTDRRGSGRGRPCGR